MYNVNGKIYRSDEKDKMFEKMFQFLLEIAVEF